MVDSSPQSSTQSLYQEFETTPETTKPEIPREINRSLIEDDDDITFPERNDLEYPDLEEMQDKIDNEIKEVEDIQTICSGLNIRAH